MLALNQEGLEFQTHHSTDEFGVYLDKCKKNYYSRIVNCMKNLLNQCCLCSHAMVKNLEMNAIVLKMGTTVKHQQQALVVTCLFVTDFHIVFQDSIQWVEQD
jgi:hypothetical protein